MILNKLRRYPLSLICIATTWYLCLGDMPETTLDDVRFIDKWVHSALYGCTGIVIWGEYLFHHPRIEWKRLLLGGWIAPILMSGVIELIQAYCTGGRRNGDWLDFAANSTGATLAVLIGLCVARILHKKYVHEKP